MASKPQTVFIGDGTTSLELDASIKEKHKAHVDVTDHAVEQGIAISDHARPKPEEIVIEGMVTNSPTTAGAGVPYQLLGTTPSAPADVARQFMRDLHDHPRILSVITEAWTYTDMVMTELDEDRESKIGDVFQFSATFKHVRQVTNQTTVVATKQPKAKGKAKKGAATAAVTLTPIGFAEAAQYRRLGIHGYQDPNGVPT
jgi:hypothetical protein